MFYIAKYTHSGKFVAVMSGMGKNKGTWDYLHGKTQAYAHKKACQTADPHHRYVVVSE